MKNMKNANILCEQRYLDEMDYERDIAQDDFNFLRQFPDWKVTQNDDKFTITNDKYPMVAYDVYLNQGDRWGSAQKYPWGIEVRHVGEKPYDPRASGHQGHYIYEKNATSNLESSFKHFLKYDLPNVSRYR